MTEKFIKKIHLTLKNGTSDSRKDWFAAGEYKKVPNTIGAGNEAVNVDDVIETANHFRCIDIIIDLAHQ